MPEKKSGFTLVELAIVLVIIGLLIGGILVAQSMISAAKINAQVVQIQQFDAAFENFKTKYRYLPGDAPSFGGNGDGAITSTIDDTVINFFGCEIANFWYDMDQQNYAYSTCGPGTHSVTPVSNGANKNAPASKIGAPHSYVLASSAGAVGSPNRAAPLNPHLYYAIMNIAQGAGGSQFATSTISNSAVRPLDLLALDNKLDDGIANSGNVMSGSVYGGGGSVGGIAPIAASACSVSTNYQIQTSAYVCTPVISIGAQTGDPQ